MIRCLQTSILFAILFPAALIAHPDLDTFILSRMQAAHIPGLSVLIVKNNAVRLARGYGYADLENQRRFTPDTTVMVASVSKTFVGTAAMQLVERGVLNLDQDVNRILPYRVRNPYHPGNPITTRQLLSHVSSIQDRYAVYDHVYFEGDSPVPLGTFLRKYLVPGGIYYRKQNYDPFAPATRYEYSNIGSALAAYVVEAASGIDFSEYCRRFIFGPLRMNQTGWFLRDLDAARLATPYEYNYSTGAFYPLPQFGYPDYPNGQLRTSARQLARFLIAHARLGIYKNTRILKTETAREMRRIQFPDLDDSQGIAFYYYYRSNGEVWLGHSGATDGVRSEMWLRLSDGAGIIMLTNRWLYTNQERTAWDQIFFRLAEEAGRRLS